MKGVCSVTNLTVNDYLLEQLERLNSDDLSPEALEKELKRADAITKLAKTSIESQEADIKREELEVKKEIIKVQYNGENGPKLIGTRDACV